MVATMGTAVVIVEFTVEVVLALGRRTDPETGVRGKWGARGEEKGPGNLGLTDGDREGVLSQEQG